MNICGVEGMGDCKTDKNNPTQNPRPLGQGSRWPGTTPKQQAVIHVTKRRNEDQDNVLYCIVHSYGEEGAEGGSKTKWIGA